MPESPILSSNYISFVFNSIIFNTQTSTIIDDDWPFLPVNATCDIYNVFYFISDDVINQFLDSLRDQNGNINILVFQNYTLSPVTCTQMFQTLNHTSVNCEYDIYIKNVSSLEIQAGNLFAQTIILSTKMVDSNQNLLGFFDINITGTFSFMMNNNYTLQNFWVGPGNEGFIVSIIPG